MYVCEIILFWFDVGFYDGYKVLQLYSVQFFFISDFEYYYIGMIFVFFVFVYSCYQFEQFLCFECLYNFCFVFIVDFQM